MKNDTHREREKRRDGFSWVLLWLGNRRVLVNVRTGGLPRVGGKKIDRGLPQRFVLFFLYLLSRIVLLNVRYLHAIFYIPTVLYTSAIYRLSSIYEHRLLSKVDHLAIYSIALIQDGLFPVTRVRV